MQRISLSHLTYIPDVHHHHHPDHGQRRPAHWSSRWWFSGCHADEIPAQRVESTVSGECYSFLKSIIGFSFAIVPIRGQRLRKYHSVPGLRLVPSDRPLFFCDNCCSANFYVPICLWCKWTSATAMKNFEEKIPRGRTMSTPRLYSAGPECMTKRGRSKGGATLERLGPRGSLDSDRSTEPPETPRSQSRDDNPPVIVASDEWVTLSVDEAILVCPIYVPPDRYRILTSRFHHPPSPLRSHSCSLIRITGDECVTGNSAHQLFATIVTLSYLSTDLRVLHGVMAGLEMSLGPSSPTNHKGFVGPPTPGIAERRAKATFPGPHVTLQRRDRPQPSHHYLPPPSLAAHCTTISEASQSLPNRLSTVGWYPRSRPNDTSIPSKMRAIALGNPSRSFLWLLTN